MALTDTAVRKAKPKEKPYKVTDSLGLYLVVNPQGSKLWRVKCRMEGVERKLSIGAYPQVTLAEARAARDAARKQIAFDVDPNAAKRQAQFEASIRAGNSFAKIAEELIAKNAKEGRAEATLDKQRWLLKKLGPDFGKRPVADIFLRREQVDEMIATRRKKRQGGPGRNAKFRYIDAVIALIGDPRVGTLDLRKRTESVSKVKDWLDMWFKEQFDESGEVPRRDQLKEYAVKIVDHLEKLRPPEDR